MRTALVESDARTFRHVTDERRHHSATNDRGHIRQCRSNTRDHRDAAMREPDNDVSKLAPLVIWSSRVGGHPRIFVAPTSDSS
jgi:homoaconitase/3-isopropylmalate dehydratase large subunit